MLEFHFERQPKPSLFISYHTKCSSANHKPAVVLSFNQGISLHPNNSVEHCTGDTKMHFLGRLSFVPLCCCYVFVSNKASICIFSRFSCRTIAFLICMSDFTAKMLQLIYFVISCVAKCSRTNFKLCRLRSLPIFSVNPALAELKINTYLLTSI